jgi:hypothetical protein
MYKSHSNKLPENQDFNGFFRGTVVSNIDPSNKGRVQIYVHGIYPSVYATDTNNLPWAEPAMSLFGGGFKSPRKGDDDKGSFKDGMHVETGVCSVPHVGAELWVFFEHGDHMKPIYTLAVQSGDGWFSAHPDQHVIHTDNVRITIDDSSTPTNKYDSYNQNSVPTKTTEKAIPATLDIEVTGNANIVVKGNANFLIEGNEYKEVLGHSYETVHGNKYIKIKGQSHEEYCGQVLQTFKRDYLGVFEQDATLIVSGSKVETVSKSLTTVVSGNENRHVAGTLQNTAGTYQLTVSGDCINTTGGTHTMNVGGNLSIAVAGNRIDQTTFDHQITSLILRLN